MTRRKTAMFAVFSAALCLILCGSMLLNGTFAWFTDNVTNADNIIKSGTLDVKMYWADGTEAVPTEDDDWTDASTGAIFNYTLWEPGYTEVRHIKIENKGNLALTYDLTIKANGEVSKLADVIDVYYADPATQVADRSMTGLTEIGTLTNVLAAMGETAKGNLKAGEEVTVTLALKMKEEAGNEYQNLLIGSDFSVVLVATQYTHENDSFNDQYDVNAAFPATGAGKLNVAGGATSVPITITNENGNNVGSAVVPAGAIADTSKPVELIYNPSAYEGNFTIDDGMEKIVVDVTALNLKEGNTEPVKANLRIPKGKDPTSVKLYHYNDLIDSTYNPNTGYVTFESATFSPFTIVYDAESVYIPPVVEEDEVQKELPKASVSLYDNTEDIVWGNYGQWSPTEGLEANLEAAYTFACTETLEDAKNNPYANWYCDFYVKLDKDLGANQIFLGGNYGSFGWVGFHNGDLTLEANTEIALLGSVTANPWTYLDVVQNVGTFICGVGDVDDALSGATFTVILRLTNPADETEFHDIATINYLFE